MKLPANREIADDNAFDFMVRGGFGWTRIVTVEIDEEGNQEPRIKWVKNPFAVYGAPGTDEPDGSDRDYLFQIEDMPMEEYENEFPESAMAGLTDFTSLGDRTPEWANKEKNTVRVAEYWYREPDPTNKKKKRVMWAKINAVEVLDGNEDGTAGRPWPGEAKPCRYIPYCKVAGDDLMIDGRQHQAGIVRHMKEPMKMYNVMSSAAVQSAMMAPLAPFVIAEGQIENHEDEWRLMNKKMSAVLIYKAKDINGTPIPPPARNSAEPPIQAFAAILARCEIDLQACSGIYNPSLGKQEGDQSGRAIGLLQKQSDVATLNFSDNLARMIRFRGRILLDLIPKVMDTPRIMRIINPDSTVRHVITHAGADQAEDAQELVSEAEGVKEIHDLTLGEYDCTVSVGPSFQTKRAEAVQSQLEMLKILPPQTAQNLLDMIVRNMDWPQSQEMADRLKKMLPPQLLEGSGDDPQSQIAQLQAQLQQLTGQHQIMTETIQKQTDIIKEKQVEQQAKVHMVELQEQSAQQVAKINADTKIAVAQITTQAQDTAQRLKALEDLFSDFHASATAAAAQQSQQAHEKAMATMAAQNAQQSQQSDQAHDVNMTAMQPPPTPNGNGAPPAP